MTAIDPSAAWPDVVSTVPEAAATSEMIDAAPTAGSPAPWLLEGRGVTWMSRATRSDLDLIPKALRAGARPVARVGMAVRYSHTPVGPYNELGGAVVYLRRDGVYGHIPFLPVDSAATMRGGRENWALPKVLAEFDGDPDPGSTFTAGHADWSVSLDLATAGRTRTLRLPGLFARLPRVSLPGHVGLEQLYPGGARTRAGFADLTHTAVDVARTRVTVATRGGPELESLLPSGTYRATALTYRGLRLGVGETARSHTGT